MTASTHSMTLTTMSRPGYWLYVLSAIADNGKEYLYAGRTGDDRYISAKPVIVRIGQHFDPKVKASMHKKLRKKGVNPRRCTDFRAVVHGPLFAPPDGYSDEDYHNAQLALVKPLERALRDALVHNGYVVLGSHPRDRNICRKCWEDIRRAFGKHFDLSDEYPPHTLRSDHPCTQHA